MMYIPKPGVYFSSNDRSKIRRVEIQNYSMNKRIFNIERVCQPTFKKKQWTKRSGDGGHYYNRIAKKPIKNVTKITK